MLSKFHFADLTCLPNLWNRVPSESNTLLPMLQAISLNIASKKNSTKPVDPSNLLGTLKCKLSIIRGVPFDFNTQQDVAEILQAVLDELKGLSLASHLICNTQKSQFLVIPAFVPLSQIKIQMTSKLL